jgi:hypothetical protein
MQDLSSLAKNGPWVTSQAGGNMMSSTEQALTAPGSVPVDPLPDREHQGEPSLDMSASVPVGTAGKRKPTAYTPTPVAWKDTIIDG